VRRLYQTIGTSPTAYISTTGHIQAPGGEEDRPQKRQNQERMAAPPPRSAARRTSAIIAPSSPASGPRGAAAPRWRGLRGWDTIFIDLRLAPGMAALELGWRVPDTASFGAHTASSCPSVRATCLMHEKIIRPTSLPPCSSAPLAPLRHVIALCHPQSSPAQRLPPPASPPPAVARHCCSPPGAWLRRPHSAAGVGAYLPAPCAQRRAQSGPRGWSAVVVNLPPCCSARPPPPP